MAAKTIVLTGGTLIDGTGRAPVENAVIVIEDGRFKSLRRFVGESARAGF